MAGHLIEHRLGVGAERRAAATALTAGQAQGLADRVGYQVAVSNRGQLHQPHSVPIVVEALCGGLDGQPGLARASHAGQGQQAVVVKPLHHVVQLGLAADERCQLDGQVVGVGIERLQRREVVAQSVGDHLEDPLGPPEVLQGVLPEVLEGGTVGGAAQDLLGAEAEQDLVTVAGREHPCRPVQRRSEVVAVAFVSDPGVESGANPDVAQVAPILLGHHDLDRYRGIEGGSRIGKGC